MTALGVWVVDDDQSVRWVLEKALRQAGMEPRGFERAEHLLEALDRDEPDVLITDIRMPGLSGLQLQKKVRQVKDGLPVLFMTGHGDVPLAVQAMQDGAVDFFEKPFEQDRFVEAVRKACEVEACGGIRPEILEKLTPREQQILKLVVNGGLNKIIADELDISIKTVEMHRSNIKQKLGVRNLAELVQKSVRS